MIIFEDPLKIREDTLNKHLIYLEEMLEFIKDTVNVESNNPKLLNLHKTLNSSLTDSIKQLIKDINNNLEELELLSKGFEKLDEINVDYIDSIARDAVEDADLTLEDVKKVVIACEKYKRGVEALNRD